jgi:hypothetical protein
MARYTLPSAKSRYLECLIMSHMSFIYTLKSRGPRTNPCGTPESTWKGDETVPEIRTCSCLLVR